ncbi:MAG: tetratricopeptide repeat protein [Burkholderiales bacterium]|nr:tetratricopeptide repeat protein [Burkholderiales bacterium]
MNATVEVLKLQFRQGRRAEAIAGLEALCRQEPGNLPLKQLCAMMHIHTGGFARAREHLLQVLEQQPRDADALFNAGMCERELKDFAAAARHFKAYTDRFPGHPDGWASLADSQFHLGEFKDALASADRALALDPVSVPAWTVRANGHRMLGQGDPALVAFAEAIRLAPQVPELRLQRAELYEAVGALEPAAADLAAAVRLVPTDDAALKKATTFLLQLDRGDEAIQLCRDVQEANPDSLTARLGAEWLLSQMVPLWHMPMMNEEARNRPYLEGLQSVVKPDSLVFEIGTGSGLLAMMAARAGAKKVVTCEAVRLVAKTAEEIVERNGLKDRITVLNKPSYQVEVGGDLPERADVLVHEIFSSELLGEFVLPALEDAKARLLKPGGVMLPGVASLMIALVGGEALGKELHVGQAFGFDLSPFNAIHPKKRPIHREDLPRVLLSDALEAFRFDFNAASTFPPEKKQLQLPVTASGLCYGVIQWIRFEFGAGIVFENHPAHPREVASWQQTIYRFDEALQLEAGAVVTVQAMHDRSRPWFEQA